MKTILFKNKEYEVPTDWSEVTLAMQMKVSEVSALQKHVKMLGIVAGYSKIPVDDLKTARIDEVNDVMASLEFMKEDIPIDKELSWVFLDDVYSVDKNLGDMQFQDFVSIQTVVAEYKENFYDGLPLMVAVLCKKKGETLDDFDPHERAETMKKMPITIASSIAAFFLTSKNYYNTAIHLSSPVEQQNILLAKLDELKRTASPLGQQRGTTMRYRFLMGLIRTYNKFLERRLMRYFKSIQSKS